MFCTGAVRLGFFLLFFVMLSCQSQQTSWALAPTHQSSQVIVDAVTQYHEQLTLKYQQEALEGLEQAVAANRPVKFRLLSTGYDEDRKHLYVRVGYEFTNDLNTAPKYGVIYVYPYHSLDRFEIVGEDEKGDYTEYAARVSLKLDEMLTRELLEDVAIVDQVYYEHGYTVQLYRTLYAVFGEQLKMRVLLKDDNSLQAVQIGVASMKKLVKKKLVNKKDLEHLVKFSRQSRNQAGVVKGGFMFPYPDHILILGESLKTFADNLDKESWVGTNLQKLKKQKTEIELFEAMAEKTPPKLYVQDSQGQLLFVIDGREEGFNANGTLQRYLQFIRESQIFELGDQFEQTLRAALAQPDNASIKLNLQKDLQNNVVYSA